MASEVGDRDIILRSVVGNDYSQLKDLLARGCWKTADYTTQDLMLAAAERTDPEEDFLRIEDVQQFPLTDLHTIESLWLHYSNCHFGFSVHRELYQAASHPYDYLKQIGWMREKMMTKGDIIWDLSAPRGHLPVVSFLMGRMQKPLYFKAFFKRLDECGIRSSHLKLRS
ncbi:MAG: GUN4 domain-containing protein [Spirulina sp.]